MLVIDHLLRALDQAGRIVAAVRASQWALPTPCADWDVRALTNHTVVGLQLFDAGVRGEPSSLAAYSADALGDDAAASYDSAAARFRQALAGPGVGERTWAMAWGDSPGPLMVWVATIELQQHGWDISNATSQRVAFDPELAAAAHKAAEEMIGQYGRSENVFGPEVGYDAELDPADRLAAFLGRRP